MDRKEYQHNYKKYHYSKTRKTLEFPLLFEEYDKLKAKAEEIGITPNKMVKEIVLNFLENRPNTFTSEANRELIQEYMRVSRGIATNINQMARNSNMGEMVDLNILIGALKSYEDEFKQLLSKLE